MFTTHINYVLNLLILKTQTKTTNKNNKQNNKQTINQTNNNQNTTGNGVKLFVCMFVKQLAYNTPIGNLTFTVTKSIFPGVFGNTPFLTV